MRKRVRFSHQSQAELKEIWDFIAPDNILAAERLIDHLVEACRRLVDTPEIGRRRQEFRPGLRSIPVGNYTIFYRVAGDCIDILHVLHGARDIEELMTRPSDETYDTD